MPDCAQMKRALAALILLTAAISVLGADTGRKILHGHTIPITGKLTPLGQLPATKELSLAIGLPLRHEADLDEFISQLYNPSSTNYHRFLTPPEFTTRFGPTEQDYATVENFARTNGFRITGTHGNRAVLDVRASVADIERSWHLTLHTYRHPTETRDFFAPDAEPVMDASVPISHVTGLDNFLIPRPAIVKKKLLKNEPPGSSPASGSGLAGLYAGNDFRAAYAPGVALNGAGQCVALFELEGYFTNDIIAYENQANLPHLTVTNILVDGYSGPTTTDTNGVIEVSLDIEMAISMATNLSKVIVYEAQNNGVTTVDLLNRIASDNLAAQISSSWLIGDNASYDTAYKQMAAQGQSFFQASGDDGAYYSGIAQSADDTNITLVGGTTLTMNGSGSSYASETVWNWYSTGQGSAGSGGGVSLNSTPIPSWQTGISMATNQGSTTIRNIPDVALTADGILVAAYGGYYSVGGTSAAAPLWAGFTALINQQAAVLNTNPVGFLNPAIYAIGKGTNYAANFHDITTGNNTNTTSTTKYFATPGYDLCTGWGTPNGQGLINTLVPPDSLLILPPNGFNALGTFAGPYNVGSQNYVLTNSNASPLAWSLNNTSAWLTASAMSGSLAAGAATNLTISLNAVANGLGIGIYSATVQFTNANTSIVQSLPFTLQVIEPLALLTTGGLSSYGPAGGPFYPGSQSVVFTNQSVSSQNWSLGNTSAWLSVSSGSGTIAGTSSVAVTVSTNAATAALTNGTYNSTLVLSNQYSHVSQSLIFSTLVGQSLVQNGGFEAGNLTGWTLSGNSSAFAVSSSSTYLHSGTYGLQAAANSSLGYITQTLTTSPGQTYQLSFWFHVSSTRTGQQLQANWNGTNVYNTTSPSTSWTNQKLIVNATSTNTQLQFGMNSASSHSTSFGLDDISVTPVNLPVITQQPVSSTNFAGSNVAFTAGATGSSPLFFQWCTNGVSLASVGNFSGANSNTLTIAAITANNAGNYTLVVTNAYGSITSSVAALTVISPAAIASSTLTNRTSQCGQNTNTFGITASGTAPLAIQWSLNSTPVAGATNATFSLTNLSVAAYAISVTITNLYGSVTSNAVITVSDSLPPIITLNGAGRMTNELGSAFTDPGATANDLCAGTVLVTTNGTVNIAAVGTNTLTYTANDGNGNSATNTRTVAVRDTTPPTISWSFTNLIVAANSNCVALMPDATGTNFIRATDLSGSVTITQSPTNNATLSLGTNLIVLTAADPSGNKSYSTNRVVVQDQTPPLIFGQPPSQTNFVGGTVSFTTAATACTPLAYHWFFNSNSLPAQTNSTLTLSNLALTRAGNYFAIATAAGGSATSAVATLTVNLNPVSVALVSSANPDGFKTGLNFTAAVMPTNASGTIQFLTNGTAFDLEPLSTGTATSTNLSTLPRGTNFITAIYSGDAGHLPATNSLAQIVTNHPPQVLPAYYMLVAGQNLSLAVADLATNWSDADGDPLTLAAINISTNGVTVTNTAPFLFYANPNYVNDQFVCVISDGFGGTNFQSVNITILPQTNSTPLITVAPPPVGGVTLQLNGAYHSTYILESATDLTVGDWQPVATNTLGLSGTWQFTDFGVTNNPSRFYRLELVP
jgi:hypothetical protein